MTAPTPVSTLPNFSAYRLEVLRPNLFFFLHLDWIASAAVGVHDFRVFALAIARATQKAVVFNHLVEWIVLRTASIANVLVFDFVCLNISSSAREYV